MADESFYEKLSPVDNFADISDPAMYAEMPDDWYVAVSDVKNSTEVIQRGGYKEVNLIGASTIMALLNLKKSFSIPFIFGGDGASICIPETMVEQAKQSLLATQNMARDLYGIQLRIGIVPIKFIKEQGYNVLVAPLRLSPTFTQAAFSGGGLQFAEECLKNPGTAAEFIIDSSDAEPIADFSGLECRWQNVPSVQGEIITLIVQASGGTVLENNTVYREVIEQITLIYGDDAKSHPIQEQLLTMSFSENQLMGESGIRSYSKSRAYRMFYWFKIRWGVILGKFLMWSKYQTEHFNWGDYKKHLVQNTDFKKFDDKLRQVLSGTSIQREKLCRYLDDRFAKRELAYGLHVASSALITCLLFNYNDAHVHLVDSDNGGYAYAAIQLKERLQQMRRS